MPSTPAGTRSSQTLRAFRHVTFDRTSITCYRHRRSVGRADGAGDRGHGADLRVFNKGFRKFVETVKNGKDTGLTMTMPRWGGVLKDEQIYQIGAYLETLAIEGAKWGEPTK